MKKIIVVIFCLLVSTVIFAQPPTVFVVGSASQSAVINTNNVNLPSIGEQSLDQQVNYGVSNLVFHGKYLIKNEGVGELNSSDLVGLGYNQNFIQCRNDNQNNTGGMVQLCAPIVGFGSFSEVIQLQTSVNIAEGILRNGVGVVSTKTNAPMMVNRLKISDLMNTDVTYASYNNNISLNGYVATAVGVKIRSHASTMACSCNYLTAAAVTNSTTGSIMAVTHQDKADNTTATISGATVLKRFNNSNSRTNSC